MRIIRAGILLLLTFSILAHGAVEVWSVATLEVGAALLLVLWGAVSLRRGQVEISWSPLLVPVLGFGGFVLLQWLLGLSVYPYLTKMEWMKLAAVFVLLFLAVQSIRTADQARGFVWMLLVLGFVISLFAIIQYFGFNGKLYWFREIRAGSPFGPYVNRNHFAGMVELIAPLGLAMLVFRGVEKEKLPLVGLLTIVPIGALFLSASRGGIAGFLIQLGLLAYLAGFRSGVRRRVGLGTAVVLLAGVFVAWLGVERALERFLALGGADLSGDTRIVMLKDTWRIFLDHPWTGTGVGTLIEVYPRYASEYFGGRVVDHAHNDYVEMLAETGLVGALCSAAFLILLFRLGFSNLERSQGASEAFLYAGALVSCSGLLLHSWVDFNFHIPANALLFFLIASLAVLPRREAAGGVPLDPTKT